MPNPTKPETALDFCKDVVRFSFACVDEAVVEFFAVIGKQESDLPSNLQINTDKWRAAEDEIGRAVLAQDIELTISLCREFEKRAYATIEDRKRKMGIVDQTKAVAV